MKNLLATLLALTLTACGTDAPVVLDTVGGGGPITCSVLCDYAYEDDSVVISARVGPCINDDGTCTSCDACHNLLSYHANQRSCDDGLNGGRVIHIEPMTCDGTVEAIDAN